MDSSAIRHHFIHFFEARGHTHIPGGSLVPEGDSSVLFTTAGMQPLVPFFDGAPHPAGRRLVDYQKCLRTNDIDEVGDASHLTFFEMLGNWSLGDYFKEDALRWSYQLLTEVYGLDADRIAVTCYQGDELVPEDTEAVAIWRSLGIPQERIFLRGRADNWWGPPGETGPCGPDSEIFYWTESEPWQGQTIEDDGFVELFNNVFIAYHKDAQGNYTSLSQQNVDTGMGYERLAALLQGVESVYETDLFRPLIECIRDAAEQHDDRAERILADHTRAAVFLIADGVQPSNLDRGYILRRLLRRAIRQANLLHLPENVIIQLAGVVIDHYQAIYPELHERRDDILGEIQTEAHKFERTLTRGLRELASSHKQDEITGAWLYHIFETYGLPAEVAIEELARLGRSIPDTWETGFKQAAVEHRERSRGGGGKFSGGLADHSPKIVRMHTATHLLNAALRQTLGDHVHQRGSNITEDRLRFDFAHTGSLTDLERERVENLVNQWIREDLEVTRRTMPREEAEALGAEHEFGAKYPDQVSVYLIGEVSKEFCAGPHIEHTAAIGRFHITKQQSVGSGVRRLRAVVDDAAEK